jgi:hypothetical protein
LFFVRPDELLATGTRQWAKPVRNRCLIPADGCYEWARVGKGKIPMRVGMKDQKPLTMAGLWDLWRDPDGEMLYSFTIITAFYLGRNGAVPLRADGSLRSFTAAQRPEKRLIGMHRARPPRTTASAL